MLTTTIDDLVADAAQCFYDAGYTERSVKAKIGTWTVIVKLHKKNGYDHYDQAIVNLFIEDAAKRYHSNVIGRTRYNYLVKSAQYLSTFHESGSIDNMGKHIIPTGLSAPFEEILENLCLYSEWSDKTKRSVRQIALPYMKWLQSEGYDSFEGVTETVIRFYLLDCSSRVTANSIDAFKRVLKKFHKFLFETGITKDSFDEVFSFSTPPEHKILKPIPQNDIAAVLNEIDRSTSKGKRDYAIILLAVVLGLRAVDIITLQFSELDWINGEIKITQEKTQKTLALPMTKDIGTALQDYILNARPNIVCGVAPRAGAWIEICFSRHGR